MKIGVWSVAQIIPLGMYGDYQSESLTNWILGLDESDIERLLNYEGYIEYKVKVLGLNPCEFIIRNTSKTNENILIENAPTLYINLTENEIKNIKEGAIKKYEIPKIDTAEGKGVIGLSDIVFGNITFGKNYN